MYDNLNVYLDGSKTPTIVEPLTVDIWHYDDLASKAGKKLTLAPMQLTIAYCQLVDPTPANLEVVKKWAREHRVQIEVVPVDPTNREPSDGS